MTISRISGFNAASLTNTSSCSRQAASNGKNVSDYSADKIYACNSVEQVCKILADELYQMLNTLLYNLVLDLDLQPELSSLFANNSLSTFTPAHAKTIAHCLQRISELEYDNLDYQVDAYHALGNLWDAGKILIAPKAFIPFWQELGKNKTIMSVMLEIKGNSYSSRHWTHAPQSIELLNRRALRLYGKELIPQEEICIEQQRLGTCEILANLYEILKEPKVKTNTAYQERVTQVQNLIHMTIDPEGNIFCMQHLPELSNRQHLLILHAPWYSDIHDAVRLSPSLVRAILNNKKRQFIFIVNPKSTQSNSLLVPLMERLTPLLWSAQETDRIEIEKFNKLHSLNKLYKLRPAHNILLRRFSNNPGSTFKTLRDADSDMARFNVLYDQEWCNTDSVHIIIGYKHSSNSYHAVSLLKFTRMPDPLQDKYLCIDPHNTQIPHYVEVSTIRSVTIFATPTYIGDRNAAGVPHGIGTMYYYNGSKYTGRFVNGKSIRTIFDECWDSDQRKIFQKLHHVVMQFNAQNKAAAIANQFSPNHFVAYTTDNQLPADQQRNMFAIGRVIANRDEIQLHGDGTMSAPSLKKSRAGKIQQSSIFGRYKVNYQTMYNKSQNIASALAPNQTNTTIIALLSAKEADPAKSNIGKADINGRWRFHADRFTQTIIPTQYVLPEEISMKDDEHIQLHYAHLIMQHAHAINTTVKEAIYNNHTLIAMDSTGETYSATVIFATRVLDLLNAVRVEEMSTIQLVNQHDQKIDSCPCFPEGMLFYALVLDHLLNGLCLNTQTLQNMHTRILEGYDGTYRKLQIHQNQLTKTS